MSNPTPEQRLDCMTLAGLYIDQRDYIKTNRGSMINVILSKPDLFPTLAKFKGQPDSPEFRKALKAAFGFNQFDCPEWLNHTRAQLDIEAFAKQTTSGPSLWSRLKARFDVTE